MERPTKTDNRRDFIWNWIIITLLIFLVLYFGSWGYISCQLDTWDDKSSFGDMFGAINALFAGLAFAGVIIAIVLQYRILKLQKLNLRKLERNLKARKSSSNDRLIISTNRILRISFFRYLGFI